MTRHQAEEQAAQDQGGQSYLHLMGLHRESNGQTEQGQSSEFPEAEGDFGGEPHIDCASI